MPKNDGNLHRQLTILGIRGVPGRHGGFETFAEQLGTYLVSRGWKITIYCQEDSGTTTWTSTWEGITRIHIPVRIPGPLATIVFDFLCIIDSLRRRDGIHLTLGYNTAVFSLLLRLCGQVNIMNMDGLEWKRRKWGPLAKAWLWLNETCGCWVANHLIADHPCIESHLKARVSGRKITMIPYGSEALTNDHVSKHTDILSQFELDPFNYAIVVARPEPENSLFEIVSAFSAKPRNSKLMVLGDYSPDSNQYHRRVMESASDEVIFPGAIYGSLTVGVLRSCARFYIHGHRVGGTNPSLVEALGAGNAILAFDSPFNRWVAGEAAVYFSNVAGVEDALEILLEDDARIQKMRQAARSRLDLDFQLSSIMNQYELLLTKWLQPVRKQ